MKLTLLHLLLPCSHPGAWVDTVLPSSEPAAAVLGLIPLVCGQELAGQPGGWG